MLQLHAKLTSSCRNAMLAFLDSSTIGLRLPAGAFSDSRKCAKLRAWFEFPLSSVISRIIDQRKIRENVRPSSLGNCLPGGSHSELSISDGVQPHPANEYRTGSRITSHSLPARHQGPNGAMCLAVPSRHRSEMKPHNTNDWHICYDDVLEPLPSGKGATSHLGHGHSVLSW